MASVPGAQPQPFPPDQQPGVSAQSEPARDFRGPRPSPPGRSAWRAPLRPVGTPIRCPRASSSAPAAHVIEPPTWLRRITVKAFINPNFARLWWGQAISSVGDYAFDTALVLWIATYLAAGQTWAPLAVSGAILAAAIPQIVVGPIAGVFVDRWDKRRTLLWTAALQAVFAALLILPAASLSLPFGASGHIPTSWLLVVTYADVALISIFAQFFIPAQFALIKDIVPASKEDQALETTQAIQGLAIIIGPPVAAALVLGLGVQWALILNTLSFVIVYLAVLGVEAPQSASSLAPGEVGHFSREFLAGLRYVVSHTILRTILISEVLAWLGFGALQALGYFFITQNLHTSASYYGYLGADFGVGAIVGAVLVTIFGERIGLARIMWAGLVTCGVFVIVLSHLTNFYLVLVAAFLFGVSATSIIVTAGPLALHATSREFVGRVTAVINPLGRLAALISVIVAGSLVSTALHGFHASVLGITFGPVDTIFTGMGALAVAGGVYARISLRDMIGQGGGAVAPSVATAEVSPNADRSRLRDATHVADTSGQVPGGGPTLG